MPPCNLYNTLPTLHIYSVGGHSSGCSISWAVQAFPLDAACFPGATDVLYHIFAIPLAIAAVTAPAEQQVWIALSVFKLTGDGLAIKSIPGQSDAPNSAKF